MTIMNFALTNMPFHSSSVRIGLKDIWNAHMVSGAVWGKHDMPFCPTTAKDIPTAIITWSEAKTIYNKMIARKQYTFHHNTFVCFYIDDDKFDGLRGIWHEYKHTLEILKHFAGAITPDYSTYQDFPEPIKIYQTYRMRTFGYWLGKNGIAVINNVRWGSQETWWYCFEGIPNNSIVAIGTVGGSPRRIQDRERFESGLTEMVRRLHPHTIVVYGSAKYKCFDDLRASGINIVAFQSRMDSAFKERAQHEQE